MDHIRKKIVVVDDLLPGAHQHELTQLVQGPIWRYGWKSNTRRDRFCYWNAPFVSIRSVPSRNALTHARIGC